MEGHCSKIDEDSPMLVLLLEAAQLPHWWVRIAEVRMFSIEIVKVSKNQRGTKLMKFLVLRKNRGRVKSMMESKGELVYWKVLERQV